MTVDIPPPALDPPAGWRLVSEEVTTPFDVRVVTVTAHTRIYEDSDLRERLAAATGAETTWRFVFASRLRISPAKSPSGPLTRLVTDRATARFVEVLGDRGFESVERADTHRFDLSDGDAGSDGEEGDRPTVEAVRFRAAVRLEDRSVPVEAYFAAWPAGDGEFLLGGGAYPLSVPDPESLDPERARDELFSMLRSIR
ncbi:hypothetical protein [Halobellus limi]|uniref:Uncharacterized protein n=1 Tax=Halobellus limi TaxID=699433 RepID=A0A1H5ZPU9_9EURY|nr:hypothetical protein [Halobellus limi]QCC47987.1 hypothetical protein DV707_10145 [Halobellus limi]SEG38583.1 hypothetical protein SAMN04488133_2125 [Halobellus limi]